MTTMKLVSLGQLVVGDLVIRGKTLYWVRDIPLSDNAGQFRYLARLSFPINPDTRLRQKHVNENNWEFCHSPYDLPVEFLLDLRTEFKDVFDVFLSWRAEELERHKQRKKHGGVRVKIALMLSPKRRQLVIVTR